MATSHITALETKHAGLEAQLHDEMTRPAPDEVTIHALKKKKLRIKEELAQLSPA
ncbi:MAG: YdcH family protein [Marinomonas sp.]